MSTRYNTGNPIESTDVRDMSDNAKNFDEFSLSKSSTFIDRLGTERLTINGAIEMSGFKPGSGDFSTGFTVMPGQYDVAWRNPADSNWYSYLGVIPSGGYTVSPGTDPTIGVDWKPVTDNILRNEVFVSSKSVLISNISKGIPSNITSSLDGVSFDSSESELLLANLNLVSSASKVTLYVASLSTSSSEICNVGANGNITISGATPVATTLTSVASVSGSAGNFSVTYNVASAAGIAVGDVLCVDEVLPARLHFSTGITGSRKPVAGEMAVGFNFMGAITVSGVSCTVTVGNCPTYLTVGDLVHIQGQTRVVQTVSASSFTIDAALDYSPSGFQWWYFSRPATGTVAISGVNITGAGTSFLTEYDQGDIIVVDGLLLEVLAVDSDTAMTTTHSVSVSLGAAHSVYKAGLMHEGSFLITGISGNQVTVKNTSRNRKPPKNLIAGGRVRCVKTVLRNDSGDGFVFGMGSVLGGMQDIALVSSGTSNTALALNGVGSDTGYNQETGQTKLLGASTVVGWGKGAFLSAGAVLVAEGQFISGCAGTGVECTDGGDSYLRSARIHGVGGIGLLASGGYARVSSAAFIGCGLQGARQDVGSGIYGDTQYHWSNGSHGAMLVNHCGVQLVDSVCCLNGGDGMNAQNSGGGRASRTLFAANGIYGINATGVKFEATQCWVSGHRAGRNGIIASGGEMILTDSAQTGNGGNGIYALNLARVFAETSVQRKNGSYGVRADKKGTTIILNSGYQGDNASGNVHQTEGGLVTYDKNPLGTSREGSSYREIATVADDAAMSIYVGNNTVGVKVISSSSNTLYGEVRARAGSSISSILCWGSGITASTGVLNGTTGVDGNFTISPALDGYIYIENRTGSPKSITIGIFGGIS